VVAAAACAAAPAQAEGEAVKEMSEKGHGDSEKEEAKVATMEDTAVVQDEPAAVADPLADSLAELAQELESMGFEATLAADAAKESNGVMKDAVKMLVTKERQAKGASDAWDFQRAFGKL